MTLFKYNELNTFKLMKEFESDIESKKHWFKVLKKNDELLARELCRNINSYFIMMLTIKDMNR